MASAVGPNQSPVSEPPRAFAPHRKHTDGAPNEAPIESDCSVRSDGSTALARSEFPRVEVPSAGRRAYSWGAPKVLPRGGREGGAHGTSNGGVTEDGDG